MGEVVNLRMARKARNRAAAGAAADANRAKFGRSKTKRLGDATEAARRDKLLDDARLIDGDA
jgi:hypothetical protein